MYDIAILAVDASKFTNSNGGAQSNIYYNPYAYIISKGEGIRSSLCFDDNHLESWAKISNHNFESIAEFTSLFGRDPGAKYFPYSTLIIMLATVCFFLTILFDDGSPLAQSFDESHPSFGSTENNKYLMRRFNLMSLIFLLGFLTGSGQSFIMIKSFPCERYLINKNNKYICDNLSAANIDLLSIIFPTNNVVNAYKELIFTGVTIMIVTNLLSCIQFNLGRVQDMHRRERIVPSILPVGEETLRRALEEFERQLSIRESERRSFEQSEFANRIAAISKRNNMIRSWKSSSKPDSDKCDDCSICLAPLFNDSEGVQEDVITVPCNHQFHKPCIIEWSINNTTCPCCRQTLLANNE